MEKNFKVIIDSRNIPKFLGWASGILLIVLEVLICVQHGLNTSPVWGIFVLVLSCILLDILCLVEIIYVKTLRTRIIIYFLCFLMLLSINIIAGSTYLSALYCIILTQLYINIKNLNPKAIVFGISCVAFAVTFVIGYLLTRLGPNFYSNIIGILSGCIVGILILTAHFVAMIFLIGYYRNNLRLSKALKEADENKKQLEEVYKKLSETAVFEERNRIARDIHDNAGHSMTGVIMQTEAAKLLIESNPQAAKESIIAANMQARNALEQMRESVHLLAGRGEKVSLKTEMQEIFVQTMDGTDLKIRASLDEVELSDDKRRFLINSLKECLANGIRHGGAKAFYVELKSENSEVTLIVSDNGKGLPDGYTDGFGIKGMREKAACFGGRFEISGDDGEGCEVAITLPDDVKED